MGTKWGLKNTFWSPWGPKSPNGDQRGSSGKEVEKNLGEPEEQREGELVKEEVRGGGEEKLQKLFCPPSYRSGFEKLGKMAKKCAVSIDLGSTYSCVGSFPAWKGLNANKKNPK